jgi:thiamine pyrophosphate-dependent acetolactate synthase large subunit-like protein
MALSIGGHLVARALAREGVRCVFTLCGGHVAPIYDGCLRENIDIIDTRHEQAAAHAADAWARLTRGPGVAIVTAGPGVTDAVTGIANARLANSPLVVLGGAAELRLAGRGALQEMEQVPLLKPITKWAATCTDPRRLPEMVQTAIRQATTGVMGPVFLELPFDVLTAQVENAFELPPLAPASRALADLESVKIAGQLLAAAERPVLFVGSQVWWDDASEVLRELVNRLCIPTVMNGMGRGALPGTHPLAMNLARKHAFRSTDLLIVVGTPLDFRVGYGAGINAGAKIVQLDRDPTQIGKNRAADVGLVGDARAILVQLEGAALAAGARPERYAPWAETLRAHEDKSRAELIQHEKSTHRPINHYRLARALADAIDPDTIVIGDGGDCVALAAKVLAPERPGHWLDPGPLGCLGVGAPFAIAAKKLYPGKKVVVLSGDGSFGLNGFDFETCVRWKLPVTCVVANDAAWGQIRGPQIMVFGSERAPATKLAPTRYDRVVEALGGRGWHVEEPGELEPALRAAMDSGEVACVNVMIDPEFVLRTGAAKLSV